MNTKPPSTTGKQLAKNSMYSTAAAFASLAIGIFVIPIVVKKFGIVQYGIYSLLTSMVGYYALLDFGFGEGIVKFVAEYRAKGDMKGITMSINSALSVQILFGLLGSAILCVFAAEILKLLKVPAAFMGVSKRCVFYIAFGFFFTMISGTFSSVLKGLQRYDTISKITVFLSLGLNIVTIIALYGFGMGLEALIVFNVLFAVFSFLLFLIAVKNELPAYTFTLFPDRHYFNKIFNFSGFMFLSRISSIFTTTIVQFVISMFLGPSAVSFYVIPLKLISVFGSLLATAFGVIFPFSSELSAGNDPEKIKILFLDMSRLLAAIAVPGFLALAVFSKPVLFIWMGPEFADKGWLVMSLLAVATLLGALTAVPNFITMGLGHAKLISMFTLFTILIYSVLMPFFTKAMGMKGAALAILCATLPGILLILYQTKNIFKISIPGFLSKVFSFHLIPLAISIVLLVIVEKNAWFLSFRTGIPSLAAFLVLYAGGMYLFRWLPLDEYVNRLRR